MFEIALLRQRGCRVSPVCYDHDPSRPAKYGGPKWHYSVRLPDRLSAAEVAKLAAAEPSPVKISVPPISDDHHVIVKGDEGTARSAVAAALLRVADAISAL